jgi:hypothetical protein
LQTRWHPQEKDLMMKISSYILVGLDSDFDGVISVVSARVEPIIVVELYGQLLSHEQRWELRQSNEYHVVNTASRGGFW